MRTVSNNYETRDRPTETHSTQNAETAQCTHPRWVALLLRLLPVALAELSSIDSPLTLPSVPVPVRRWFAAVISRSSKSTSSTPSASALPFPALRLTLRLDLPALRRARPGGGAETKSAKLEREGEDPCDDCRACPLAGARTGMR